MAAIINDTICELLFFDLLPIPWRMGYFVRCAQLTNLNRTGLTKAPTPTLFRLGDIFF